MCSKFLNFYKKHTSFNWFDLFISVIMKPIYGLNLIISIFKCFMIREIIEFYTNFDVRKIDDIEVDINQGDK